MISRTFITFTLLFLSNSFAVALQYQTIGLVSAWDPEMAAFTAEQEKAAAAYPPVKVELPLAPHRRINDLLGLRTYFTAGPKEARAWTIPVGATGPQAAGVIHTDFEKGFIRAETIAYDDYVRLNGEAGARDAGKMRLEGKDYVVQDGDVMHFRFNT